jgi:tRNA-Thr(GGU) m(6)t(6)A37 methyltransferase TsaA
VTGISSSQGRQIGSVVKSALYLLRLTWQREKAESKTMKKVTYEPIGLIRSPFNDVEGMPIQPTAARGIEGKLEIEAIYENGLKDLIGFSHIIVIYHFHLCEGYSLKVQPFLDDRLHGVFATRAPRRPNAIGLSVVRLVGVEGCTVHIEDVDIVDKTPLLDIKPYVLEFDARTSVRTGWLSKRTDQLVEVKADKRFR